MMTQDSTDLQKTGFSKKTDPRHVYRQEIIQMLFAGEYGQKTNLQHTEGTMIMQMQKEIDVYIEKYAPKFAIEEIAKTDLAILRLGIYELLFMHNPAPAKVVINECVELAKEMGSDESYAFINAVLGAIYEQHRPH